MANGHIKMLWAIGRTQETNSTNQIEKKEIMKYALGLFLLSVTICSCGQDNKSKNTDGLVINPQVKYEAEKNIESIKEFEENTQGLQLFENNVTFDFYENDSLILSSQNEPKKTMFKSFYMWDNDTLVIDGGIGLFGTAGFSVQIINGKATVYHMLSSDEFPTYAYGEKTQLLDRLEVACHDITLILSEIPDKGVSTIIYGYVEFKSDNYFTSQGAVDGKEYKSRTKSRSNMKMYFKSGEFKI